MCYPTSVGNWKQYTILTALLLENKGILQDTYIVFTLQVETNGRGEITVGTNRTIAIDYRCDNRRFWLSAHNCQVPTPTSQNLEVEQQIQIFGAD